MYVNLYYIYNEIILNLIPIHSNYLSNFKVLIIQYVNPISRGK